jgi:hypothetical protein
MVPLLHFIQWLLEQQPKDHYVREYLNNIINILEIIKICIPLDYVKIVMNSLTCLGEFSNLKLQCYNNIMTDIVRKI